MLSLFVPLYHLGGRNGKTLPFNLQFDQKSYNKFLRGIGMFGRHLHIETGFKSDKPEFYILVQIFIACDLGHGYLTSWSQR